MADAVPLPPDPFFHTRALLLRAEAALASAEIVHAALRISELRYRRLFEMARDGILILETENGTITDANPFMTELLGYSREEMLGKQLWEIGLLQDKEASQEAFRQLEKESYIRYDDLPLRNRNGQLREVEFVSNLYREGDQRVIQCNIRDITDRKRTSEHKPDGGGSAIAADGRDGRDGNAGASPSRGGPPNDSGVAALPTSRSVTGGILQRSTREASSAGRFAGFAVETLHTGAMNEAEAKGDFFDAFTMANGKVAFVVGDVSGKGLIAAGRTAEVKYALRAFLHEYQAPEVALARLNDFICQTQPREAENRHALVVLAVAKVDTATGEATFSAAGAEPALILRESGTAEPVEVVGSPLGRDPDSTYASKTVLIGSGDTVLMATDGITEAKRGAAFLGLSGMAALAKKAGPRTTLLELSQAIYRGARDFAGAGLRNDVCLLIARRLADC